MDKMISDKMIINLDVFSSFIKNIIVSNMNSTVYHNKEEQQRVWTHLNP